MANGELDEGRHRKELALKNGCKMTLLLRLFSFFIQSSNRTIALLSTVQALKKVKTGGVSCAVNRF
jgi:hypothetical protein